MTTLKCNLSKRIYEVKKICHLREIPRNARYLDTIYFEIKPNYPYSGSQDIYVNNSGYFATPIKN